ncbi:MAG: tetratricopeptide repeat protein [Bacteroidota bacterium]
MINFENKNVITTRIMKRPSFYTQGQRSTARILLTVWLLAVWGSPDATLAAPDCEGASMPATTTSPGYPTLASDSPTPSPGGILQLPPDSPGSLWSSGVASRPSMERVLQEYTSQEAVPYQRRDLLRTSPQVTALGENLSFQARAGEQVRFQHERGQWHAEVSSHIGAFARRAVLPVVCSRGEDPTSSLEVLSKYPSWQRRRRIHVLDGKVFPALGEVVYLGELGLRGGGEGEASGSGEEREEYEREYDNTTFENLARVNKTQSHLLRVVFQDPSSPEASFANQLAQLKILLNSLGKAGALFISQVSPDSPYLLGMLYGNNLILLKPVGVTQDQALYTVLSDIKQQSLVEELYVSDALIAQEKQSSYAGPIVAELMRHYSQLNKKEDFELALSQLYSLGAGWQESIPDQASEQSPYKTIDVSSLLPPSLSSLGQSESSSPASTGEVLTNLRQSHVAILSVVSDATESLPEQLLFDALVSGESINDLEDNPHYRKLQEESTPSLETSSYQGGNKLSKGKGILGAKSKLPRSPDPAQGSSSSQLPGSSQTPQATRPEPSMPSSSQAPSTSQAASQVENPTTTTDTPLRISSSAKGKEPYRTQKAILLGDLGLARIDQLAQSKELTQFEKDQLEAKKLKEQIDQRYPRLLQTTDEADAKQLIEELITPLERLLELTDQTLTQEIDNAQNYLVSFRQVHHERWGQTAYGAEVGNKLTALLERAYVQGLKAANSDLRLTKTSAGILRLAKTLGQLAALDQERGAKASDLSHYTEAAILYQHVLSICEKEKDTLEGQEVSALQDSAYQGLAQLQASMLVQAKGADAVAATQADAASLQKRISEDRGELEAFRADVKPRSAKLVNDLEAVLSDPDSSAEAIKLAEEAYIQGSKALFGEIAQWMGAFPAKLYQESELALGQAPCKYTVMGLGSMALQQITPYSDLEFAILMEDAPDEDTAEAWRAHFRKLTHLVHFRVINLGETVLPFSEYNLSLDHLGKRGLNFDLGGKTPLGRKDKPHLKRPCELIQPVSGMMKYLKNVGNKMEHMDKLLPYILESTCYVHGDRSLHERYVAEKRAFLLESRDESGRLAYQKRALKKLLEGVVERDYSSSKLAKAKPQPGDLADFEPRFGVEDAGRLYDVKQEIYRLPDRLLYRLAMYHGLLPTSGWDAVAQLQAQHIIGVGDEAQQAAHHLHYAVSFATMLRLQTYLHHGQQFEKATMLSDIRQEEEVRKAVRKAFTLPPSSLQAGGSLFKYYYTALPLHSKMQEFFETAKQQKVFFQAEPFYDDSDWNKGTIYHRLLQYKKSLEYQKRALEMFEVIYKGNHPNVATLLNNVGLTYGTLGNHQETLVYLRRALEMFEVIYKGNHPNVATSLNNVGLTYEALGQYQEALKYHKRSLEMREAIYEENHPNVATSLNNIGTTYRALGDHQAALTYHKRALKMFEAIYEENHPDVATSLNNVGTTYGALGRYPEALTYHKHALEAMETIYGGNHPIVAASLGNVSVTYRALGQHREALDHLKCTLEVLEDIYKDNHPYVATALDNVGATYGTLGQYQEALEYHKRALKMFEAIYKEDHPNVATSLNNVGLPYRALGQHQEALEYHKRALKMFEAIYKEDHPNVAASLNNVGLTYEALGQYQEALKYHKLSLEMREAIYEGNHPDTATSLNNVGMTYGELGQHIEALVYLRRALAMKEVIYEGNHPNVATSLNNVGLPYRVLGQHQEALGYHKRALKMFEAIYKGNHPNVATSLNNVGLPYRALGQHQEALEYHKRALKMFEAIYKGNHPNVAASLDNVGLTHVALAQHREALDYLKRALKMRKAINEGDHPDVAQSLNNVGLTYVALAQHQEALDYLKRALKMRKAIDEGNHLNVAAALNNVGLTYRVLGNHKEALDYLQHALEILKTIYTGNHADIALALSNVGLTYRALGHHREALDYLNCALEVFEAIYARNYLAVARTLNALAETCYKQNDIESTIKYYEKALSRLPSNDQDAKISISHNLGCMYHVKALLDKKEDDEQQAQAYLEKANVNFEQAVQASDTVKAGLWTEYGNFLLATGKTAQAHNYLHQVIESGDDTGEIHYGLLEQQTVTPALQAYIIQKQKVQQLRAIDYAYYLMIHHYEDFQEAAIQMAQTKEAYLAAYQKSLNQRSSQARTSARNRVAYHLLGSLYEAQGDQEAAYPREQAHAKPIEPEGQPKDHHPNPGSM